MRQFQIVPTTYVTEIKETYFEIYTPNKRHAHWISSFKHVNIYMQNKGFDPEIEIFVHIYPIVM